MQKDVDQLVFNDTLKVRGSNWIHLAEDQVDLLATEQRQAWRASVQPLRDVIGKSLSRIVDDDEERSVRSPGEERLQFLQALLDSLFHRRQVTSS